MLAGEFKNCDIHGKTFNYRADYGETGQYQMYHVMLKVYGRGKIVRRVLAGIEKRGETR